MLRTGKKLTFILFALAIMMSGCSSHFIHEIEKNEHGVTIYLDSSIIQIEVVDQRIIHVKKQLSNTVESTIPDYVTILEPQDVAWEIAESENQLTISTNMVNVVVNGDGTIEYQTKVGKGFLLAIDTC